MALLCFSLIWWGGICLFFNFGLRWNKSVCILASSGWIINIHLLPFHSDLSLHFPVSSKGTSMVICLTLICIHMAWRSQPWTPSKSDVLFLCHGTFICQAAIFVLQLWQSKWHAVPGCPDGTSQPQRGTMPPAQRNEEGCSLDARFPGHHAPVPRHLHLFVCQGQGTKCCVIHIKLSGWKQPQMLLFLCLVLSPLFVSSPSPTSCHYWLPKLGVFVLKTQKKKTNSLCPWKRSSSFVYCIQRFFFLAFVAKSTK